MKKGILSINQILVVFLGGLLSCIGNKTNSDSSTDSDSDPIPIENIEMSKVKDTCRIDSILTSSNFLFSNQDTMTLIKREQLLYPLDMRVRKILKNHRYGNYFYVSSYDFFKNFSMFTYAFVK